MANKRDLKKQVRAICSDMATECMLAASCLKDVDAEKMAEIVTKIAALQTNALQHVSFDFDKVPSDFPDGRAYHKAKAAYFKAAYASFNEKFLEKVEEILKEMNAALPQAVKDANKKS